MRFRAILLGTLCGLAIGSAIVLLRAPQQPPVQRVEPLGEDHGRITSVVMQYQPDAGSLVVPIYTQFLAALGKQVEVTWVVGKLADVDDLQAKMGSNWHAGKGHVVVVGKEITTWSKDRFVTLAFPDRPGASLLCAPARLQTPNPLRTNDQEIPYCLAQKNIAQFQARATDVNFDGGDFLATRRHLFASPAIFEKNPVGVGMRFRTIAELKDDLNQKLARHIIWLGDTPQAAPAHHLGMFLTVIGNTAAVGDVRMAEKVAASHPETLATLQAAGGIASPAFRADLSARLDRVARQMQTLGYRVVRVPLLPSTTPRAWLSYNNGIVETRNGKSIFYMPTFGAKTLDTAAAEIFQSTTGCTVEPIDCAHIWPLGGSLHCLVNVVARDNN